MVAHSQYCMSGDYTFEATKLAVEEMASGGDREEGAKNFVFVVSDCNLERYRLDPAHLGEELVRYPSVRAHMIMIASLGDEAADAVGKMPVGRGHVCLDTSTLPVLFKNIFTDELLE
jgi:von Willebrand factor A domain-containing protein 8